jgi:gluconokinase
MVDTNLDRTARAHRQSALLGSKGGDRWAKTMAIELSRQPSTIVLMGVSGSGKSTLGAALAERIGCAFQEGDDLHPLANIEKMRGGAALSDADRGPWLAAVAAWASARAVAREWGVISCSALRRRYRDRLRAGEVPIRFVLLDPGLTTLRERMERRAGHFMPASLLDSQRATLELPTPDEDAIMLVGRNSIKANCETILKWLGVG